MEQVNTTRYVKGDFITVPNKSAIKPLKATTQAVFMWIASYADENGQCFPSRRTIANNCGISLDTVDTHIKKLEESSLLVKIPRKEGKTNKTNIYQIILVVRNLDQGVAVKTTLGSRKNPTENYTTELNHKYIPKEEKTNSVAIAPEEFSLSKVLDGIRSGEDRDMKVIGLYIVQKKIEIDNRAQFSKLVARCRGQINAYKKKYKLHPFEGVSGKDIKLAMQVAEKKYEGKWTFETVMNRVVELAKGI